MSILILCRPLQAAKPVIKATALKYVDLFGKNHHANSDPESGCNS